MNQGAGQSTHNNPLLQKCLSSLLPIFLLGCLLLGALYISWILFYLVSFLSTDFSYMHVRPFYYIPYVPYIFGLSLLQPGYFILTYIQIYLFSLQLYQSIIKSIYSVLTLHFLVLFDLFYLIYFYSFQFSDKIPILLFNFLNTI